MATVRVFNPSSYTPRSYFAERGGKSMSRRRRHNPFGISTQAVKDGVLVAGGALGSLWVDGFFNQSGWVDVATTALSAGILYYGGKAISNESNAEELLKGGIAATVIKAVHQAGFLKSLGLGTYVPGWFAVPTASDQYLRTSAGNVRGVPPPLPAAGVSGYNTPMRARSRYVSRYQ
jgi:hypothetical protein